MLGPLLTPVLGLSGTLNLIAVAVVLCVLASVAIASLAVGLRISLWAQVLVAAACWLIIADSAFFDVFGGPFSEPPPWSASCWSRRAWSTWGGAGG